MTRKALPMRRPNVSVECDWNGHPLTVTVGFHPKTGRPVEVFADAVRGGQMAETIRDACIIISVALQFGVLTGDIAKSLGSVPDLMRGGDNNLPSSPIGAILKAITSVSDWDVSNG